ncbi:MutS-related protein [Clostridium sp. LBM24168]
MFAIIIYLIIVFIILAAFSIISSLRNNGEIKNTIEEQWGKRSDKKYGSEEIDEISGYFQNIRRHEKESFFIDEITWNDLDLDEVFKNMDTTLSTPGEEAFYTILRKPIYDEKELQYRNRIIEYFRKNIEKRKSIQYMLGKLGIKRQISISNYFYDYSGVKNGTSNLNMYRVLRILPVISIGLMFLNLYFGIICISICFITNVLVYYFTKTNLDYKLRDFTYINKIIKCGYSILKVNTDELGEYNDKLKKSLDSIKGIKKISFNLESNTSDIGLMMGYFNMLFLTDLINYEKMSRILKEKSEEFRIVYSIIGNIDSFISIASYRDRIKNYCIPELYSCSSKKNQSIIIKDMMHPLIDKAIPNSLKVEKSILITGSNASGKSTFLKAMALNIIFSQTICTCTASYFRGFYVKIYTSMALRDDVLSRESYYVVETKSLKRIIDNIDESLPTICFVDEILRGTNTVERIAASSQLLKYITLENCICVAATHDVELTYILENYFENYHFQENILDNKILFDYKIYRGRSMTQNAIKLLSILGYKDDIVYRAQEKAEEFLKSGIWKVE